MRLSRSTSFLLLRTSSLIVLALCAALLASPAWAQPQLRIANGNVNEGDGGTTEAVLTITLTPAAQDTVTVAYATVSLGGANGATGGDAPCGQTAGQDYVDETGTARFAPGETSATIGVEICGDIADEPDEILRVQLSDPVGATATTSDARGRATIRDDDELAAPPEVSIDDLSVPEGNVDAAAIVTLRLSAPASQTVTVRVALLPPTALPARTATVTTAQCVSANADFRGPTAVPVSIDPGAQTGTASVFLCGDATVEDDEVFALVLRNPVNATLGDSVGLVTIVNDDEPAPAPLTVSIRDTTFSEGDLGSRSVRVTVALSGISPTIVTARYAPGIGGTAASGRRCGGADFLPIRAGTVTIPPGSRSGDIPVTVCGDLAIEGDETFSITLSNPTGAALGDPVAAVTIRDDEVDRQVVPRDESIVTGVFVPARAELDVDINANLEQVAPDLAYVVEVRNEGAITARNVVVRSTLPRDVSFVAVTDNQLGTCGPDGADDEGSVRVRCTLSTLAAGATRSARIVGRLVGGTADGAQVFFGAFVDPENTVPEGDENDNTAFHVTTLRLPPSDLRISGGSTVRPGTRGILGSPDLLVDCETEAGLLIRASFNVRNLGPSATVGFSFLTADWPAQITAASGAISGVPDNPCFERCALGALNPGQTISVSLFALMGNLPAGQRSVTVRLDPNELVNDPNRGNNTITFPVCEG